MQLEFLQESFLKYSNIKFMKIRTRGAQFFHADGQTMTMLIVAFRNWANAPIQAKETCLQKTHIHSLSQTIFSLRTSFFLPKIAVYSASYLAGPVFIPLSAQRLSWGLTAFCSVMTTPEIKTGLLPFIPFAIHISLIHLRCRNVAK